MLAVFAMAASVGLGAALTRAATGWLPVVGSCFATWGILTMQGISMRLMVLVSTFLWLTNNILSRSIGGTVLESFIALASGTTIARLVLDSRRCGYRSIGSA